jgi:ribA/ribD-fused uncharacterized protein
MINSFRDCYSFLSNFYPAEFRLGQILFPTSEHAYQYFKSMDLRYRANILKCKTPSDAKKLGKSANLIPFWEKIKVGIMYKLVHEKFFQNPELAKWLIETKDEELVEGNTWNDTFWGVCNKRGKNYLGKILMKVRKEIKLCTVDAISYLKDLSRDSKEVLTDRIENYKKKGIL